MGYATKEDIDELYGTDLLVRIADYDRDGTPDPDVIEKGLLAADEVCNAYLSAQYTIPVVPTPGVVRTCAIDIAVYKMALGRGSRTDEMRLRYEGLGLPPTTGDNGEVIDPNVKRSGRSFDSARA